MNQKYVIGLDYGTLSGRAVLARCNNGEIVATAVKAYSHGVMDQYLPDGYTKLPVNWALEHPQDYLDVLDITIPKLLHDSGIAKEDIIGISIDFTSCTVLPIDKNGVPLCMHPEFIHRPNAYVKLWKHHGAQQEADQINALLESRNEITSPRFGGRISSELLIPKVLEIIRNDYEVYEAADEILEAGDWLTRLLTGSQKRSGSMAGYKAWWLPEEGYPKTDFYAALDTRMENIVEDKLSGDICPVGGKIGVLSEEWGNRLGLMQGMAVGASIIDSHAGAPGSGIRQKGQMMLVVGTSSVMVALSDKPYAKKGVCGALKGGIIPGYYALESGLAAVGDMLGWFVERCVPESYANLAKEENVSVHELLTKLGLRCNAGSSGLLALDWWNGNKTPHVDGDLSGVILGMTLRTKPEEIYRALIESTAYGTRMIIETFEEAGIEIAEIIASGGIAEKNPLFMQIYADVTGKAIKLAASNQTAALGSAIYAAVAAGKEKGGYASLGEAVMAMSGVKDLIYHPIDENKIVYERLYEEYKTLSDYFGPKENGVLKRLYEIKVEQTRY
ncbi:ribulokinase [Anaerobium acetethylicum]|uniref:Ribulokinase n=1 Tax=Anaerobium acetethylicum TaxID=1619234 RepID=A0A1D3TY02_9FIRM|nr:ribulokinase [Anaerobium acetethylicum]SCP99263.1 L-ribulokinase [Anaerobium acetethylicum]